MKTKNTANSTTRFNLNAQKVAILVSIIAVIVSASAAMVNISIARSHQALSYESAQRARIMEPIDYETDFVYDGTFYQIEEYGATFTIPAEELQLRITRGTVRTISALRHNGERLHFMYNADSDMIEAANRGEYIVIITELDPDPLVENGIFYDYFFLYMEPVQGAPIMDMIVIEVDIRSGEIIRRARYQGHDARRLDLNEPLEGPTRDMLEVFQLVRSALIYS